MSQTNEDVMTKRIERSAEAYAKKYRKQMEALEHSPLAKFRGLSVFDYYSLGEQLSQFDDYKSFIMEDGSAGDLGKLPDIAYDVITAVYGTSILPIIASVQPIEEERGTVYFKRVKAMTTRGNVTAGATLSNPRDGSVTYPQGYAGERVTVTGFSTVGGTTAYTGNLPGSPMVRPNTLKITVATLNLKAVDDGVGNLLGIGIQGSIDYSDGSYSLTFIANPAGVYAVTFAFGTNFEESGAIPKIQTFLDNDSVEAEIFALSSELGLFKSFALRKRFGKSAEDELVQDLTAEINAEIGHTAIARLVAAVPGTGALSWNKTPGTGVSYFEHKQELKDVIARSESTILTNAGRGVVNGLIAGPSACGVLSNLPGFEKVAVDATGPQLYGNLDGLPVIRSPLGVATDDIIPFYKGKGNFEAPLVYSPYMPLFITEAMPVAGNILKKQRAAAVWAGLKVLIPAFLTKISITTS